MSEDSANLPVASSESRRRWPLRFRPRRPSRRSVLRWLNDRYGSLPAWLLLVQIFLAAGWLRAASAHGLSMDWWTGVEISEFRREHRATAIEWYQQVMLAGPVTWAPAAIAAVVLLTQIAVAGLLAFNTRILLALALGAFLNVNFVLAGAVDPSAFYLVLGSALAIWHVDASLTSTRIWWLTLTSTVVGFTLVGSLAPQVTTVDPATVIEDPAMVLTFIALLWVAALWLTFVRRLLVGYNGRNGSSPSSSADRTDDDRPAEIPTGHEGTIADAARRLIELEPPDVPSATLKPPPPEDRPNPE